MEELKQKDSRITLGVIAAIIIVGVLYTWFVIHKVAVERAANNPANESLSTIEGVAPYTDMAGNPLSLSEHVGSVLVVNSWASWSPDSVRELPALAEIVTEYAEKDVKVIAINRAEPQTTAERFLRTVGAADAVQLVLDPDDHFYHSIQGYAMPETIFYDRKGGVVHHHHGVLTKDEMKTYLEMALSAGSEE
ncbi:MAG: TlpA family protein disulfide reductase [Candidatus Pacebacteria bacterium]|nr:TlpA family protein disulfide reductase [Candidatus Paceibacterota bacterium]